MNWKCYKIKRASQGGSIFKGVEKKCGIESRSISTNLPFLSLIQMDIISDHKGNTK